MNTAPSHHPSCLAVHPDMRLTHEDASPGYRSAMLRYDSDIALAVTSGRIRVTAFRRNMDPVVIDVNADEGTTIPHGWHFQIATDYYSKWLILAAAGRGWMADPPPPPTRIQADSQERHYRNGIATRWANRSRVNSHLPQVVIGFVEEIGKEHSVADNEALIDFPGGPSIVCMIFRPANKPVFTREPFKLEPHSLAGLPVDATGFFFEHGEMAFNYVVNPESGLLHRPHQGRLPNHDADPVAAKQLIGICNIENIATDWGIDGPIVRIIHLLSSVTLAQCRLQKCRLCFA